MAKPKPKSKHSALVIDSEVVRQMRQHARSQMKTEVCGVLIGSKVDETIRVDACIQGVNATQAGTHVTFTQDTWEHVYKIKDSQYPDQRIVGWYHSHPGFGVFLSDHDTFIHKNFFSSPDQVAYVYDPHSDEEGCFGWVGERLERMESIEIKDHRGGELVDTHPRPEPSILDLDNSDVEILDHREGKRTKPMDEPAWMHWTSVVLSHLAILCLGLFLAWVVFPRIIYIGVPVDPNTGQPLMQLPQRELPDHGDLQRQVPNQGPTPADKSGPQQPTPNDGTKGNNGRR